jgi:hypothetical protein
MQMESLGPYPFLPWRITILILAAVCFTLAMSVWANRGQPQDGDYSRTRHGVFVTVAVVFSAFSLCRFARGSPVAEMWLEEWQIAPVFGWSATGETLVALGGALAMWFCVERRRYGWATAFAASQLVFPAIIEGLRFEDWLSRPL